MLLICSGPQIIILIYPVSLLPPFLLRSLKMTERKRKHHYKNENPINCLNQDVNTLTLISMLKTSSLIWRFKRAKFSWRSIWRLVVHTDRWLNDIGAFCRRKAGNYFSAADQPCLRALPLLTLFVLAAIFDWLCENTVRESVSILREGAVFNIIHHVFVTTEISFSISFSFTSIAGPGRQWWVA